MLSTKEKNNNMSNEEAYHQSIADLEGNVRRFLDAIGSNAPDFVIHDLALSIHGSSDDVLMFSPVTKAEKEADSRDITDEEMNRFTRIVRQIETMAYDPRLQNVHTLIEKVTNLLGSESRDNAKIRMGIQTLDDYCRTMGLID